MTALRQYKDKFKQTKLISTDFVTTQFRLVLVIFATYIGLSTLQNIWVYSAQLGKPLDLNKKLGLENFGFVGL